MLLADFGSQDITVHGSGLVDVRNGNCHVVQFTQLPDFLWSRLTKEEIETQATTVQLSS